MAGIIGFAPVYMNGLLAIFFVFVFPGLVLVRAFNIPSFPQRWFVVFLSSQTANHFLMALIATLHLDPLTTYRVAAVALIAILIFAMVRERAGSAPPGYRGQSIVLLSDAGWLLLSLTVLCLAYFNVWKHGVPNIFEGGDLSASWNPWALNWSQGSFPPASYGYPQFVPTIWAVTYLFTGSIEQYFAFYIYIVWIIAPIVLNAMNLGRISWWHPLLPGYVFVWFVIEIREPWLKASLEQAYPDWVAAIFGFCGAVLFITTAPEGRLDREKITSGMISLCLVSIAGATKPIYGLLALAVLIGICTDAARYLQARDRNRLIIAAVALVSGFVVAYAIHYSHLVVRSMPNYPVSAMSDRLSRAVALLNSNLTLPFRVLVLAGLLLSPFIARARWLALPLLIGTWLWANTASYDLRNLLGLLLICAFIPLYSLARGLVAPKEIVGKTRWVVPDGAIALGLAALLAGLTLPVALGDKELRQRFVTDQFRRGAGLELNQSIEQLLRRGCTIFSADGFIYSISTFQPFRDHMEIFAHTLPLGERVMNRFNQTTGCISIFYPPDFTHPAALKFITAYAETRGLKKVAEGNGMELIASP